MRRDDDVRHGPERRRCGQRFLHCHVKGGTADALLLECGCDDRLVHDLAARDVHEVGGRLHSSDLRPRDEVRRLGRQRTGEHDEVGFGQLAHQRAVGDDLVSSASTGRRVAARCDHLHAEGLAQCSEPLADASCTDDEHGLALDLVLADGAVALHAAPGLRGLCIAQEMELAREGQHERDGVLGDGIGVDAMAARKADAVLLQDLAIVLVRAGADGLDELQARVLRRELVLPHHGDGEHVGVRQLRDQLVVVARDLEGHAGLACRERLGELVGDVREEDVRILAGGEGGHVVSLVGLMTNRHNRTGASGDAPVRL